MDKFEAFQKVVFKKNDFIHTENVLVIEHYSIAGIGKYLLKEFVSCGEFNKQHTLILTEDADFWKKYVPVCSVNSKGDILVNHSKFVLEHKFIHIKEKLIYLLKKNLYISFLNYYNLF